MPRNVDPTIVLIGMVAGIGLAALVGAVILRAAVGLFNRLAGGEGSRGRVREPGFAKAMGIALLFGLIGAGANWEVAALAPPDGFPIEQRVLLSLVMAMQAILVQGLVVKLALATRYHCGLVIAFFYSIIALAIAAGLYAVVYFGMR